MDTVLSEVLVFKLFRAETTAGAVASPAIVITLYIIKYRRSHYFPAGKTFSVDAFHFQRVEDALRTDIIVAVAPGAHAAPPRFSR
ncbi:membrane protein [[Pantoea] beijingensis]|uniref:Membrane protein n=1 Tax=[Pantoea] beijingensis TaxID=1324864 RepID=A0A443IF06_9GAMM|nr:membrane protein [[Pantoea] beijingensis]